MTTEHPWQGNTRCRHRSSSRHGTSCLEEVPLLCTLFYLQYCQLSKMRMRYSKIPTIRTTIKQNKEEKQNWWKSTRQLPADRSYFIFPTIVVGGKNKTKHNIQELTGWGRQRSGSDHEYNSPASYLRSNWEHGLSSCLHGWQWIWTTKKIPLKSSHFFFKSWPLPSLHPQNALPWQKGVNSQTSFIPRHFAAWDLVSPPRNWPHVGQVIQGHTLLTIKRSSRLTTPSSFFFS